MTEELLDKGIQVPLLTYCSSENIVQETMTDIVSMQKKFNNKFFISHFVDMIGYKFLGNGVNEWKGMYHIDIYSPVGTAIADIKSLAYKIRDLYKDGAVLWYGDPQPCSPQGQQINVDGSESGSALTRTEYNCIQLPITIYFNGEVQI